MTYTVLEPSIVIRPRSGWLGFDGSAPGRACEAPVCEWLADSVGKSASRIWHPAEVPAKAAKTINRTQRTATGQCDMRGFDHRPRQLRNDEVPTVAADRAPQKMCPSCGPSLVSVRISGPDSVIKIVCSNWADRLPSLVRTVHLSL